MLIQLGFVGIVHIVLVAARIPVVSVHGITATTQNVAWEVELLSSLPQLEANFTFHAEEYARNLWTVFSSLERQIENLCKILNTKPVYKLASEIVLIGHSNGGVVSRGVVETCDLGEGRRVSALISVGSPQMGIRALPNEGSLWLWKWFERVVLNPICERLYRATLAQRLVGPAGYFYRPADVFDDKGRRWFTGGTRLAILNNEVEGPAFRPHPEYKSRFGGLDALLLIRFKYDEVIKPIDSVFFSRVTESGELVPVNASGAFWDQDLVGVRTLMEAGKTFFYESANKHDSMSDSDITGAVASFLQKLAEDRQSEDWDLSRFALTRDPSTLAQARHFTLPEDAETVMRADVGRLRGSGTVEEKVLLI